MYTNRVSEWFWIPKFNLKTLATMYLFKNAAKIIFDKKLIKI